MKPLHSISDKVFKGVKKILSVPKKIFITTHKNPDGDAIGSALGLYIFLKNMGHDATVVTPNGYPEFLQWMPFNKEIIKYNSYKEKVRQALNDCDLVFCVDFNDTGRLSQMESDFKKVKKITVLIDHHPYPQLPADYVISTTEASSTAEIIYNFICAIGAKKYIDTQVATCLFAGIMTDTGSFAYSSSSPETFRVVSELLKYGVDKDDVHYKVYDTYSENRMRLLGYCLNEKMVVLKQYKTAYIWLTKEELKKYNFITGDDEGLVNFPLSIKDIRVSAIFIEKKDHVKISFRSRGKFAVNTFSQKHFKGGGHLNAAGGKSELPLQETIKQFLDLLPGYAKDWK
ncbi:MAG: bifunctional oligoribonuclease/PAP phosphatase NrnA [Bacteroidia bacterium]|nr:bifunctional oligoribonuclease/PAP phosphatase NrnA [Bacteroidia bacterium]